MLSQLPRIALMALVVWPLMESCSRPVHSNLLQAGAPGLQSDDTPHLRREGNPNAPYLVASAKPQLVKRSDNTGNTAAETCDGKDLSVTEIAAAVNGDYHAVKLAFYNQGLTACKIGGFPSISLLDKNGNPISSVTIQKVTESTVRAKLAQGSLQQASATPQAHLIIAPRSEAWFQLGWTTGDGCPTVSRISVSAPGSTETFTVNHPLSVCDGRIEITALHPDDAD